MAGMLAPRLAVVAVAARATLWKTGSHTQTERTRRATKPRQKWRRQYWRRRLRQETTPMLVLVSARVLAVLEAAKPLVPHKLAWTNSGLR